MIKIPVGNLFILFNGIFDYVLCVDDNEKITHSNSLLCKACGSKPGFLIGKKLPDLLSSSILEQFQSAMTEAKAGCGRRVIFSLNDNPDCFIPLRTAYAPASGGGTFLFFGDQADEPGKLTEWEKDEQIKELACLYSVAEWIKVSASVHDFFTHLPKHIRPGMHYPESAAVYSVYQGQEYGRKLNTDKYIKTKLEVSGDVKGEIMIGYNNDEYETLPEEQKMLDGISRILSLALERKELADNLALKAEEEAEFARRVSELETIITARTQELDKQQKNLETVNAYLGRMDRDWGDAQARLETIFEAIPDKVAIISREHNVIMTNRDNVTPGNKCYKTFFNRDKPCSDCRLLRVIREKTPVSIEIKHEDEYFNVHALPIYTREHEVDGIIEFYRNITREKNYEQQLQQADKLASIGQLVSGIGHEINNPNQFIRGNIKIIQQALEDILPIVDEYQESHPDLKIARLKYDFFRQHIMTLVDDMGHGSKRIKDIVEGLKRFARKDEGALIDAVEVNTIIEHSARLVHNEVHKHADIDLDLAPDLPAFTGNSQKIEQVMINLMMNASQAMPDERRGHIRIATRMEDSNIIIEAGDDGKGMGDRTIKQIFDPFFTTRRAKGGTGLGLPIVYRIIEEHGGVINVTSRLGAGTTFLITIPTDSRKQSADDAKEKGMDSRKTQDNRRGERQ